MLNELRGSKYIVEFFQNATRRATPSDRMYLRADNDSDAIVQARWLARHTYHNHFQVRAVANGVHTVIFRTSPLAQVA
jgi:hypothetical protein